MALQAGRLRHRIDIQENRPLQDPQSGAMVDNWVTVWPAVPAAIEPLSAREFIAAQAVQSQISDRVVIRYRDGLHAAMRILHKGQILNPAGWLPDKDYGLEYLTAPCSRGVNNG